MTSRISIARFLGLSVLALVAMCFVAAQASADIKIESFDFSTTEAGGVPSLQAAAHPNQLSAAFTFGEDPSTKLPFEQPRELSVDLPPGSVGDPTAVPACANSQLLLAECPNESQVGLIALRAPAGLPLPIQLPLYNMKAPPGVLAEFAFMLLGVTPHLFATVHSEPDYGVTISLRNLPSTIPYTAATNVFWGVPADPSHDESRGSCLTLFGPTPGGECKSNPTAVLPFLTNPSACTPTSLAHARANSWQSPIFDTAIAGNLNSNEEPVGITGCDQVEFDPTFEARPTTDAADSPSGLNVHVHVPQHSEPEELSTAQLRDLTLELPLGMSVNPASAAGLEGCDPDQIGLSSSVGDPQAVFDEASPSCPDGSKIGTVEISTPVIPTPLLGSMYLATPEQNPFSSLLGLYVVVQDPTTGVIIKLAGHPQPDPRTGQLLVSFEENPQLPFEDLDVNLYPGARAALKTPLSCGSYRTESTLTPWTSPEGQDRHPTDTFAVTASPAAHACPSSDTTAPNTPRFEAGTRNPAAGTYSPFTLRVARADGSQPLKQLDATLPKGLLGKLAGISYCSGSSLAAAAGHSGRAELAAPSCPMSARLGSVEVAAGPGPNPLYVNGDAYLAGPYEGAPLSLAIVTPAVAGPFDLGTVVVRNRLEVDPETTQIHAISDPIPSILQGIPLDLREIKIALDRPQFTFNPTNCDAKTVSATTVSIFEQSAALSDPFGVGGCNQLSFKPKLKLKLSGGTNRRGHPALSAVLTYPQGAYANIARAQVSLPGDMLLDNAHIGDLCTRSQVAAHSCPASTVIGFARAATPLLDRPLEGPVFLAPGAHKLPDIVAELNGQIRVLLRGRVDSNKATNGLRNTFEAVPDAPVSRFELKLKGGKKGLIQNSRNLCATPQRARASFDGQNGKIADYRPKIQVSCGKVKKRKHGVKN